MKRKAKKLEKSLAQREKPGLKCRFFPIISQQKLGEKAKTDHKKANTGFHQNKNNTKNVPAPSPCEPFEKMGRMNCILHSSSINNEGRKIKI